MHALRACAVPRVSAHLRSRPAISSSRVATVAAVAAMRHIARSLFTCHRRFGSRSASIAIAPIRRCLRDTDENFPFCRSHRRVLAGEQSGTAVRQVSTHADDGSIANCFDDRQNELCFFCESFKGSPLKMIDERVGAAAFSFST